MEPIEAISGHIRSYMNRCVNCEAGRAGTCSWITRFGASDAPTVSTPLSADETHEDRALRLHDTAADIDVWTGADEIAKE